MKDCVILTDDDLKCPFDQDFFSYIRINNMLTYYEYFILRKEFKEYERMFFNESL